MKLTGRRVIYTDESEITRNNVLAVLREAVTTHDANRIEIEYLWKYYKGDQPVLYREKMVENGIKNNIVINHANEIVSFKTGYLMGEPVQYVCRGENTDITEINRLNAYMHTECKGSKDKELADDMHIYGTAYRIVLPNDDYTDDVDACPFEINTLEPSNTFVVYHNGVGNKPLMAVTFTEKTETKDRVYSIYTKDRFFKVVAEAIVEEKANYFGIPIIEYPLNKARIGSFEIVIELLNAINTTRSNQVDGVEQFVQALMMFKGVDVESEDYMALKEQGAICVPADGDIKYIVSELNQMQTNDLVKEMETTVLAIVGMPSFSGGNTSDSSNNGAVILKNGWYAAEARAKDTELMYKPSELQFLRLALKAIREIATTSLRLSDIDIRFTRRNYEDIQSKAQVLVTMLGSDKISPKLAFQHCGMFSDPDVAYTISKEYYEKAKTEEETRLNTLLSDVTKNNTVADDKENEEMNDV